MPRYDYILFDADNTLFDFDRAERQALRRVLEERGYPSGPEAQELYLSINRGLWSRFDRGEVTQDWLAVERFAAFARAMGRADDPVDFNRRYLTLLGEGAFLLPGAEDLCRTLARRCTLAVVTNGMALAQHGRFERSALAGLVPWLFISEELGVSKPDPAFFEAVLQAMGVTDRSRVLMVGDNLLTDVRGGLAAGIDSVWYNPGRLPGRPDVVPTYTLDSYLALEALILS